MKAVGQPAAFFISGNSPKGHGPTDEAALPGLRDKVAGIIVA
jgi:hypothetical protein